MSWRQIGVKIGSILVLLYFFVCSLGFLSDSFRLIAGKAAGINEIIFFRFSKKE